ncbi:Kelch repeat-containing protein [Phenylobacterium sp.]|jgi:N-acetylneuraminic acid mutarotase|uniref:Kelch repeat-containing protein n=1 Tax=Phenylobacterium sp. TaxID=1871053 RepID=UPI002F9226F4
MIDRRTLIAASLAAGALPTAARAAARWEPRAEVPWPVQEVYGAAFRGKVVIAGGMAPGANGLRGGINPQDRTGIYDPVANRWSEGPRLPFARHHPVLATARDRLYAFGGYRVTDEGGWVGVRDGVAFDGKAWTAVAPMPQLQCETVAVTLGERIHVASGRAPKGAANRAWTDQGDVALHQVFDARAGRWTTAAPCPLARNSATGAAVDGLFYLAGGRRVGAGNSAQLDRYDPKTDRWETLRPMPRAAGGLAGAAAGGKLYVFGGEGGPGVIPDAWCYDPKADSWTAVAAMRTPRHGLAGVAVGGRIYAVGGGAKESGGQVTAVTEALITD